MFSKTNNFWQYWGLKTQGLPLVMQALYHLGLTSSPFSLVIFHIGHTFLSRAGLEPDPPIYTSFKMTDRLPCPD
jgi:hypothetical protein